MKAVRIHEFGGPEVLKYEELSEPALGPRQALVNVQAIGVNFADVYNRRGSSPSLALPLVLGIEAAGVVAATGEGVTEVSVGDTVAYWGARGSYAQQVTVPASMLVKIPEGLDARAGAAVMVQGMTAHYLAYSITRLKPGDSVLVHAGAGGTGLMLVQMAKRAGATVLATVSTEEKAALVLEAGADKAIIYTREDFEEEVRGYTQGRGVQVAYDSVGKDTFDQSLNCLARRGYLALYGQASGAVPPVDTTRVGDGSRFFTRPSLFDYTADREELLWRAGEVLGWVASGELKLRIWGDFPLADAAEAHRQMENRETTGKLLLIP